MYLFLQKLHHKSLAKYEIHLCDTAINTTGYKVLINTSKRYHLHFNDHVNPTTYTARKMSKYGVFSGPSFPVFGLNTEFYSVNLRIQSK